MTETLSTGIVPTFELHDRLRKARETKGWEQRELADQLGIHRQTLAKYERGEGQPRRAVLMGWAFLTGVDLFWLRGEDNPVNDEEPAPVGTGSAASYTPRDLNPEPTDYGFEGDSRFFCLGAKSAWELAS